MRVGKSIRARALHALAHAFHAEMNSVMYAWHWADKIQFDGYLEIIVHNNIILHLWSARMPFDMYMDMMELCIGCLRKKWIM